MATFIHYPCTFHSTFHGNTLTRSSIAHLNPLQPPHPSPSHNPPKPLPLRCSAYNQPPKKPGSKNWLKENKLYRKPIPLSKLGVGECRLGTVRNLVPWGAYVSIGAEKDGLIHVRDMSEEYVAHPSYKVTPGDCVQTFVKFVDVDRKILALSLIPVKEDFEGKYRVGVGAMEVGQKILAIVKRVTNYGAYVDVGCTRDAWVHVGSLWGDRPRATLNELKIGEKIWVFVDSLDKKRQFISCRARTKFGVKKLEEKDGEEDEEYETILKDHPRYGQRGAPSDEKVPPKGDMFRKELPWEDYNGEVIDKDDKVAMERAKEMDGKARAERKIAYKSLFNSQEMRDLKKMARKFPFAARKEDEVKGEDDYGEVDLEDDKGFRDFRDDRGRDQTDKEFLEQLDKAATERYQTMDKTSYNFLAGKRSHLRPPKEVIDPY